MTRGSGPAPTRPLATQAGAVAAVSLKAVSKSYPLGRGRRHVVFDGLSLEVRKGEFVALLGPSGCGKSTLLKILGGLEPPDGGCVVTGAGSPAEPAGRVGLMLQSYPTLPWLTVGENIRLALPASARDGRSAQDAVDDHLARVGLFGWHEAYPRQLSGGMLQRVALARTLAMQPDLVLLDEPLGALDALTRLELQTLLRRLHAEARGTFIMVTHDVEEALTVASRIVVLGRGGDVLYDSAYAPKALDRRGLLTLLGDEQVTVAAGAWAGLRPLAESWRDDSSVRLWAGLSDRERLDFLREGRAAAALFTLPALAGLQDRMAEPGLAVLQVVSQPLSGRAREQVIIRRDSGRPLRWVAAGAADTQLIGRLDPGAGAPNLVDSRAAAVDAVAQGVADACLAEADLDRRRLSRNVLRDLEVRPLPEDIWPDLWTVLAAPPGLPAHALDAIRRALAEFVETQDNRVARRAGVRFLTPTESDALIAEGELDAVLRRWGGTPTPVAT